MDWSPQQDNAMLAVSRWLQSGTKDQQVFRLFGYAGTGKTSLAKHLVQDVEGEVYFAAMVGKAAMVLKRKGCPNASTVHSLIYKPVGSQTTACQDIKQSIGEFIDFLRQQGNTETEIAQHPRLLELKGLLTQKAQDDKSPKFRLNTDSVLSSASLLVLDEVSMVDRATGIDLESFKCPILVLGDPAQLPPIRGSGYFTEQEPDVLLTEIHRQAADNPIIRLATMARCGKLPPVGQYGTSRVITKATLKDNPQYAFDADQVLCGTHKTRIPGNHRIREMRGRGGVLPQVGDKLVTLRNNKPLGIFNGGLWDLKEIHAIGQETMTVTLVSRDVAETLDCVNMDIVRYQTNGADEIPFYETEVVRTDFGDVLTVHKFQGSQDDNLLLIDESPVFRNAKWQHLYTGITRAAESIVVAI
jgi:ATP-dependent exoDNAse (exonuclease V) alpha subunit